MVANSEQLSEVRRGETLKTLNMMEETFSKVDLDKDENIGKQELGENLSFQQHFFDKIRVS